MFEALPEELPRVISIGRLDFNTEGLLLLTNDGALARHLELPATGWLRRYRVRAHGAITQEALDKLKDGIEIDGVRYGPIEATLEQACRAPTSGSRSACARARTARCARSWRRLGLDVNRLIRVSFGPFQLLDLEPGAVEPVKRRVLASSSAAQAAAELGIADDEETARPPRKPAPRKRKGWA